MKDPAVLLYTSDFLNGVADLTFLERGQYITLLCLQHQKGHLSEKMIRLSVGDVSADVLAKFKQDNDGSYFNERMEVEIEKRKNFCESRRKNRISKPKEEKHISKDMSRHMSRHMENENENVIVSEVKVRKSAEKPTNPFSELFLEVWQQWKDYKRTSHRFSYKTLESENIALAQLAKSSGGNEQLAIEMIHHSIAQGYKGIFAPDKSKTKTNGKIELTDKFQNWLNKA